MQISTNLLSKFLLVFGILLTTSFATFAQSGLIRGTVSDERGKEPLIGATVMIKGTSIGAVTGTDGSYVISTASEGEQTLIFSYLGFQNLEVNVTVVKGETLVQNVQLLSVSSTLDEVVVTGLRKSQLTSINSKKIAENQRDVLSTDNLGRLPDINVAEATQRVAGVSIETDAGEGRFISIRGIQPSLVNVSLNGGNLASTSQGRETPLNLLPIEMIGSIEVMKTVTPDMEATAIGGSVNINTITAFDRVNPQFLVASVDGLFTDQQVDYGNQGFQSRLALTTGKRFGEGEKFGVVVAGNYFSRDFAQNILDPDRWQLLQGTDPSGVKTPGYLGPNEIEIQYEANSRKRYGFNADLEYRPSSNSKYYFRSLYTHNDETNFNNEFELTVAGVGKLVNQTLTSGTFEAGSGELDLSSSDNKQDLYSFNLGSENRFGRLLMTLNATYSRADQNENSIDGTFENDKATEPLLAAKYDLTPFFFDILPLNLETASNTDLYFLRNLNFRNNNTVREDMYEGSADFKYNFNLTSKVPAYLKMGGRVRSRDKVVDRSREAYDDDKQGGGKAPNRYKLTEFAIDPPKVPVGNTQPYVSGDAEGFRDFFAIPANRNNTDRIFFRQDATNAEIFDEDINYRETVTAAYLMGVVDTKFVQIVGGVRVENTNTVSAPFVDSGDGYEPLEFENNYTNWLPSLNLRFNLTEDFVGRAAWTTTLGRANYDQLAGTSELNINENNADGTVTGTFEGANPDLLPYLSTNYDFSLEYYLKSGGLISGGVFFKNIENQIFRNQYTENNVEFAGHTFDELRFTQFVNLNTAKIRGIEGSFDQSFTFLPGFWSGFGITANAAYIKSEAEYPGREDEKLRLLRQPELTYNIIPYFQRNGWEFRVAVTHRSDFLVLPRSTADSFVRQAIEANPSITEADFDVYESARTGLDITGAYTFPSKKVKILAQARNLNNAPEQEYQGVSSRYDSYQTFGASYFLGFSLNF